MEMSTKTIEVDLKEYSYNWAVGVSGLKDYCSERFSVREDNVDVFSFRLDLYPSDCRQTCTNYACICLRYLKIVDNMEAYVILSIHNKEERASIVNNRFLRLKSGQEERFFHKLATNEYLRDEKNGFIIDGQLRIQCKIYCGRGVHGGLLLAQSFISAHHALELHEDESKNRLKEFDDFEQLLQDNRHSDIKLIAGNQEFRAHKSILSARSRVFSAMFEHDMKEKIENTVEITDVDPGVLNEVLRFIYTGKVNIIENMKKDLFRAADKYELNGLKIMCEKAIMKNLTLDNVVDSLIFADTYKSETLMKSSLKFFLEHAKEINNTENFKDAVESYAPWIFQVMNGLINEDL